MKRVLIDVDSNVISFRIRGDKSIEVGIQKSDGTWLYADGTSLLPSGLYITVFSKWNEVIKELEDIINSSNAKEQDLQLFFDSYPELLKGDSYNVLIPQANIIKEYDGAASKWKADFVLSPFDQANFCKVLELKVPTINTIKTTHQGHSNIYAQLLAAINQLRDYGDAFHSTETRKRFHDEYGVEIFKPDLQLIAGRRWDYLHMKNMLEHQRRHNVSINDWDTVVEQLRRKFT